MAEKLYRYYWGNNSKRRTMKGRICRILCRGGMNSVLIEFIDNGQREVVSHRSLRCFGEVPEGV